jgi:hypothetical protein
MAARPSRDVVHTQIAHIAMDLPELTPSTLLGLLADEDRLKVVAAVVLGARTPAEIAEVTGLTQRTAVRALARLAAGGLVTVDDGAAYRVRTEVLREAAAQGKQEPGPSGPDSEAAAVLGRFIRGDRLVSIPSARSKRLVVLNHFAGLFEPGRRYTEAEVNRMLGAWHPDYATLRRYLVDEGFLRRRDEPDPDGGRSRKLYWRTGGTFDVD